MYIVWYVEFFVAICLKLELITVSS